MARTSPDGLQRLVRAIVETFDAHLDLVRRDMAAQQEALIHEVRVLHEATIRAMAEVRAAVHRVELAAHDQLATSEPTPAAGLARPLLGSAPPQPAPARDLLGPQESPDDGVRPTAVPAAPPPPSVPVPTLAAHPVAMTPPPAAATAPAPDSGLDIDRLVAMLEARLDAIDMTSGTTPAPPTA